MRRYLGLKIAAAGLALSLLLHLASFSDYEFGDKLHRFLNVLGIGLAVVWVANIPARNRLGAGLSTLGRRIRRGTKFVGCLLRLHVFYGLDASQVRLRVASPE